MRVSSHGSSPAYQSLQRGRPDDNVGVGVDDDDSWGNGSAHDDDDYSRGADGGDAEVAVVAATHRFGSSTIREDDPFAANPYSSAAPDDELQARARHASAVGGGQGGRRDYSEPQLSEPQGMASASVLRSSEPVGRNSVAPRRSGAGPGNGNGSGGPPGNGPDPGHRGRGPDNGAEERMLQMRNSAPPNEAGAAAARSMGPMGSVGRGSMLAEYGQMQSRRLSERERSEQQDALIPPVDRYDDDDEIPFYKSRNGIIVIAAVCVAFFALIISLAVTKPWASKSSEAPEGVSGQSAGAPPVPTRPQVPRDPPTSRPTPSWYLETPDTPAPTRPPAPAPGPRPKPPLGGGSSLTDEQLQRYQEIYDKLINVQEASDPSAVSINALTTKSTTNDTPQQKALNWIAFEDELELRADEDPSERIAQRYALAVLYFATDGDQWDDNDGWLTGNEHECTWYGLDCENRQIVSSVTGDVIIYTDEAMVTEMSLQDNRLRGGLTQEIVVFRWMIKLSLYDNSLQGSLPDQIGELTNLERMWLDTNQIGGSFPTSIGKLTKLIQMDVFNNRFTSSLPTEIGEMKNLERLSAYSNLLRGSIPSHVGRMDSLRELFLDGNDIVGTIPEEIGDLTKLKDLRLHDNSLIGSLPSSMANLRSLNVLYLDSNDLTGSISAVVGGLVSIVDLQAFRNKLTGTLPAAVGDLDDLVVLDLNTNDMNGDIPSILGDQGTIQKLDLSKNKFDGEIPPSLKKCTEMKRLHLAKNKIEGEIPTWVGAMRDMKTLLLDSNDLDGTIPEELGDMEQLLELTLEFNSLRGEVPQELCRYNLQRLSADCDGINAPVECSCCTACCSDDGCTRLPGVSTATSRYKTHGG